MARNSGEKAGSAASGNARRNFGGDASDEEVIAVHQRELVEALGSAEDYPDDTDEIEEEAFSGLPPENDNLMGDLEQMMDMSGEAARPKSSNLNLSDKNERPGLVRSSNANAAALDNLVETGAVSGGKQEKNPASMERWAKLKLLGQQRDRAEEYYDLLLDDVSERNRVRFLQTLQTYGLKPNDAELAILGSLGYLKAILDIFPEDLRNSVSVATEMSRAEIESVLDKYADVPSELDQLVAELKKLLEEHKNDVAAWGDFFQETMQQKTLKAVSDIFVKKKEASDSEIKLVYAEMASKEQEAKDRMTKHGEALENQVAAAVNAMAPAAMRLAVQMANEGANWKAKVYLYAAGVATGAIVTMAAAFLLR